MFSLIMSIIAGILIFALVVVKIVLVFLVISFFVLAVMGRKLFRTAKRPNIKFLPQHLRNRVPRHKGLYRKLEETHMMFQRNRKYYSELDADFENLWNQYLSDLEGCTTLHQWMSSTDRLLQILPHKKAGSRVRLATEWEESLERMQKNIKRWQESEQEVQSSRFGTSYGASSKASMGRSDQQDIHLPMASSPM